MTDIEMLPLPETLRRSGFKSSVEHYARANVAHAVEQWKNSVDRAFDDIRELRQEVAAKDAEIERLRADMAAWRELSDHVRAGACNAIWPDRYTDARTRDVAAALKRAERLAEALRDLLGDAVRRGMPEDDHSATEAQVALRDHDKEARDD